MFCSHSWTSISASECKKQKQKNISRKICRRDVLRKAKITHDVLKRDRTSSGSVLGRLAWKWPYCVYPGFRKRALPIGLAALCLLIYVQNNRNSICSESTTVYFSLRLAQLKMGYQLSLHKFSACSRRPLCLDRNVVAASARANPPTL